jgi:metal-responsive CopG/Arc/MetJ family transcriptional regulator
MKERITITIDKNLLKKLDRGIKEYKYASRSHGFEYLISREISKR